SCRKRLSYHDGPHLFAGESSGLTILARTVAITPSNTEQKNTPMPTRMRGFGLKGCEFALANKPTKATVNPSSATSCSSETNRGPIEEALTTMSPVLRLRIRRARKVLLLHLP